MALVFIPAPLRDLTRGLDRVEVAGATLRQVIANLDARYPGLKARVLEAGDVRPGIALAVNGVQAEARLLEPVPEGAEVQILPAIGGGRG